MFVIIIFIISSIIIIKMIIIISQIFLCGIKTQRAVNVMRGTQRGTNLLSLSRMTWEPEKRLQGTQRYATLGHTSSLGNLLWPMGAGSCMNSRSCTDRPPMAYGARASAM